MIQRAITRAKTKTMTIVAPAYIRIIDENEIYFHGLSNESRALSLHSKTPPDFGGTQREIEPSD